MDEEPGTARIGQPRAVLIRIWRDQWFRAFLLAIGLLVALNAFVLRLVTVRSTSMFATLRPGDLLLVQRWANWTGYARGDMVVFRDPLKDRGPWWRSALLVKRIAALPGDTLEIRDGVLLVNGSQAEEPTGLAFSHLIRLRPNADALSVLLRHGIPTETVMTGRSSIEAPLTSALRDSLETDRDVISVAPMSLAKGGRMHIFPFSPRYAWNGDDFGPLMIPRREDTLRIDAHNLPLYDRLISIYERHRLSNSGDQLLIDGLPLERYRVEEDYCFVLGDSRHFSADSRYWGFLPMNRIVGRAVALHRAP